MRRLFLSAMLMVAFAPAGAEAAECRSNRWQPTFVRHNSVSPTIYYVEPGGGFTRMLSPAHAQATCRSRGVRNTIGGRTCRQRSWGGFACGCNISPSPNATCARFQRWLRVRLGGGRRHVTGTTFVRRGAHRRATTQYHLSGRTWPPRTAHRRATTQYHRTGHSWPGTRHRRGTSRYHVTGRSWTTVRRHDGRTSRYHLSGRSWPTARRHDARTSRYHLSGRSWPRRTTRAHQRGTSRYHITGRSWPTVRRHDARTSRYHLSGRSWPSTTTRTHQRGTSKYHLAGRTWPATTRRCQRVCVRRQTQYFASDGRHRTCCAGGRPNPGCVRVTCTAKSVCLQWATRCQ